MCNRKNECLLFFLMLAVIGISLFVYIERIKGNYTEVCELAVADYFVLCWYPFFRCILLSSVILFFSLLLNYYNFNVNRVIRYSGIRRMCRVQIFHHLPCWGFLSFAITVLVICIGRMNAEKWIDFSGRNSLFAHVNKGAHMPTPPFIYTVILFWGALFLYMELVEVVFMLMWVVLTNRVMAFLVTYVICFTENYLIKTPIMFNRINIGYEHWLMGKFGILGTVIIVIVLTGLYERWADRKDLLNVQ